MGYRIGIIAGKGKISEIAVNEAKKQGYFTIVGGFKGFTEPKLKFKADEFLMVEFENAFELVNFFKENKVKNLFLIGKIEHNIIYRYPFKNKTFLNFADNKKDNSPSSLFKAFSNYLNFLNFNIKSIKFLLKNYFSEEKIYTNNSPSKNVIRDIEFGWRIAKKIASLDIGQTIVIKDKAVVAVEGMEGTDKTIRRGGKLAGEGITVLKVGRPRQNMRFDVPVVGLSTIKEIAKVKGRGLCIEADRTIFLDKNESISLAKENNISIISIKKTPISII